MPIRETAILVCLLSVCLSLPARSEEVNYYDLLSTDAVAARQFVKKNPTWDGRGTVIAVLDTGVDMSVEGLRETTTGEVKVIEARDFSGQGVIHLTRPVDEKEGTEPVLKTGKGAVRGFEALSAKPDKSSLLLGFVDEKSFVNSSVSDLNENGRNDDKFALLVGNFKGEKGEENWRAWVDTDGDGSIADEEMQEEYSLNQKYFFFTAKADQRGGKTMAVALHLEQKRREAVLHFADGSHGSHVAGIAAGHDLFGREGFDGIAPGAKVMSLKIGDNTLSGGSTTTGSMRRAIEFAGSWSEQHKVPVVVNLSYGIGAEKEGESAIDRATDRLLAKYPLLSLATSAGNSGPGLSTVGTPAGADLVFSTGALLTRGNASTLYGTKLSKDVIFYFSSRGGELGKPDGLAPGCAASTVPPWEQWVVMRGTSMASPQLAGCMSLLASGAVQSKNKVEFNGGMMATALRNSGRPIKGYNLADQGGGLVHVPTAWDSLRKLASAKNGALVAGYKVKGDCPTCPDGRARSGFFRSGTYVPAKPDAVSFHVTPIFMAGASDEFKEKFFATYDLKVEGGNWLSPTAGSIFFKGTDGAEVDVMYDPSRLKEPGIYTALVRGTSRELGSSRLASVFELWNMVIVPYVFDLTSGFERRWEKESMDPGDVRRYFLRVPEGAASMRVELSPVRGKYTQSRLTLFDPDGHEVPIESPYADSTREKNANVVIPKAGLTPGVWEVVVLTHYVARGTSSYDLEVKFSGFEYDSPGEFYYDLGSAPRAVFQLRTLFDQVFEGRGSGGLYGFHRTEQYGSQGDRITFPITLEKDTAVLKLKLSVDLETYARFTDCAINVLDHTGAAVEKDGFSSVLATMEIRNPNAGRSGVTYEVEVIGGFAEHSDKEWTVTAEEFHEKSSYIPAKVWCEGYAYFTIYPNKSYGCEFELQDKPPIAPTGYSYYGELRFKNARTRKLDLVMPLRMRVGE